MLLKFDENITLELLEEKHVDAIFSIISANRIYLREWLPWVIKMQTIEDFRGFISLYRQKYTENSDVAFVIVHVFIVVGRIGVYNIDAVNKNRIGWLLAERRVSR